GDSRMVLQAQEEIIEMKDVFSVKLKRRRFVGQKKGGTLLGITIFKCLNKEENKLTDCAIHLNNLSEDHCHSWFRHLKEILNGFQNRPKSLKVFVNPSSHKREATHVYYEQVAPLFKLADIKTDVTVTEYEGHALSVLKECELQAFDGVVCVGGDGSVSEVAHGLLLKAQIDAGKDTDYIPTPVRALVPLGVIPAGETKRYCYILEVIYLQLVEGWMHYFMFLNAGRTCFIFPGVMKGWGFALFTSATVNELHRFQRRVQLLVPILLIFRSIFCLVLFISLIFSDKEKYFFRINFPVVNLQEINTICRTCNDLLFVCVISFCFGEVPIKVVGLLFRLNNGSMALIVVQNTSRTEFIKHLKRYASVKNQFNFPFVETYTVQEVKVQPRLKSGLDAKENTYLNAASAEGNYPWNIDGDLMKEASEVHVRVHPQLINLYGVNTDDLESFQATCSCI
ncbi:Ceramide kinase-like protein, partial [Pygoscelis antarcticus]